LAQTGKDVVDIDIIEKISYMVIDTVKAGAGLQSSNANLSPSSRRNSESLTNRDDIPSFDLFKEGDPAFNFMYGDDMVRTKIGKEMRVR
jgi:hypothetical protein